MPSIDRERRASRQQDRRDAEEAYEELFFYTPHPANLDPRFKPREPKFVSMEEFWSDHEYDP